MIDEEKTIPTLQREEEFTVNFCIGIQEYWSSLIETMMLNRHGWIGDNLMYIIIENPENKA